MEQTAYCSDGTLLWWVTAEDGSIVAALLFVVIILLLANPIAMFIGIEEIKKLLRKQ